MANEIRLRQGVQNLDVAGVTAFREAYRQMMAITDNRGFGAFAGLHGTPGGWCWHGHRNPAHFPGRDMLLFLPWHRAYLYNFEMAMRDRVPGVTLPWWDWTLGPPRQNGVPQIFADKLAGGKPNPLFSFRMNVPTATPRLNRDTVRQPAAPEDLPTSDDVATVMAVTDWSEFSDALEGQLHNRVHGWVGGDMGIVAVAAFDPIFWSHHAMIDRLWWLWQARNGNGNIPPELMDVVLAPFSFKVRDVLSANALGYDYAAAQTVIAIGGPS
jgi:tyrosinase